MFPRKRRITRSVFPSIRQAGRQVFDGSMSLRYKCSDQPGRFSVVIRSSPTAVARNRLRRRIYAILSRKKLPFDGIFYIPGKLNFKYAELSDKICILLDKASKACN